VRHVIEGRAEIDAAMKKQDKSWLLPNLEGYAKVKPQQRPHGMVA
jgi:hypothetical protein